MTCWSQCYREDGGMHTRVLEWVPAHSLNPASFWVYVTRTEYVRKIPYHLKAVWLWDDIAHCLFTVPHYNTNTHTCTTTSKWICLRNHRLVVLLHNSFTVVQTSASRSHAGQICDVTPISHVKAKHGGGRGSQWWAVGGASSTNTTVRLNTYLSSFSSCWHRHIHHFPICLFLELKC